ncbi:MAG: YncE family protein [Thermoplasmata archaeon]|nr:YncE family protein [Thermoplasmata archaeon]
MEYRRTALPDPGAGRLRSRIRAACLVALLMAGGITSVGSFRTVEPVASQPTLAVSSSPSIPPVINPSLPRPSDGSGGFGVVQTLVLFNDSQIPGNFVAGDGLFPSAAVYDPIAGVILVTDAASNNVSVINDVTNQVIGSISVGADPVGGALDTATGQLYVADQDSNCVSVVDVTTESVVATVPVGSSPQGVVYDSGRGEVFVSNDGSSNVSVINDSTDQVTANVPVGGAPGGMAYDNRLGEVFVTGGYDVNVSVINDSTSAVVASVSVAGFPVEASYLDSAHEIALVTISADTLVLINDTTYAIVATIPVGSDPGGMAFDPRMNAMFVANSASNNVSVANLTSDTDTSSVPVGSGPVSPTLDASTGEVFVPNHSSSNVSVINVTSDLVVASILVGSSPNTIAYDSGRGELYVTDEGDNVTVLNDSSDQVSSTFETGAYLYGVAYDSGRSQVFVVSSATGSVSVTNDSTNQVVATVGVGTNPNGIAYDPGDGDVYVTNQGSADISVISDTTDQIVQTIAIPGYSPEGIAYDSAKGELFVANGPSMVSVISDLTNAVTTTIPVGNTPFGVAYDPTDGEILVTNSNSDNVSVINDTTLQVVATTNVGAYPEGVAYVNGTGSFLVANYASNNVSVISDATDHVVSTLNVGNGPTALAVDGGNGNIYLTDSLSGSVSVLTYRFDYTATFNESGLPAGTEWFVNISRIGSVATAGVSAQALLPNGSYDFTVATGDKFYVATPQASNFTISGSDIAVSLAFSAATLYALTANEAGLPIGTQWYLNITGSLSVGSTSSSASADLPNGTYQLEFSTTNLSFAPTPEGPSVTVSGAPVGISVVFELVASYAVNFSETGLPTGTSWYVNITHVSSQSSSTSSISTSLPNGSYLFAIASSNSSYVPSPASGSILVNGAVVSTSVSFSIPLSSQLYSVRVNETGLPNGSLWYFNVSAQPSQDSTTSFATINETNGTYLYTLAAANSLFGSSIANSTFTVAGLNLSISVTFAIGLYPVTFTESGLASGSLWSARVSDSQTGFAESQGSTTNTITFQLANGTYQVMFTWPPGYVGAASIDEVTVDGRAIAFPTVPVAASSTSTGSAPTPALAIPPAVFVVVVIAIALLTLAVLWRWRRAPPEVVPSQNEEGSLETAPPGAPSDDSVRE